MDRNYNSGEKCGPLISLCFCYILDDDTEPHSDPVPEESSKKKKKKSKKTVPAIKIKIGKKKRGRKKAASVSQMFGK